MNQENIREILSGLSGRLVLKTKTDQTNFEELQKALVTTEINTSTLRPAEARFEKASLLTKENIQADVDTRLSKLADKILERKEEPQYKVFVRELSASNQLIQNTFPEWGSGAVVEKTVGPFTDQLGREIWYDFFRIKKLMGLYVEGSTTPMLLFEIRESTIPVIPASPITQATTDIAKSMTKEVRKTTGENISDVLKKATTTIPGKIPLPKLPIETKSYDIVAGSIWIQTKVLCSQAAPSFYSGLKIKGGKLTIFGKPVVSGNNITITPPTQTQISLSLDQVQPLKVPDANYGTDARQMKITLPANFSFDIVNGIGAIKNIEKSSWEVFTDKRVFTWNPNPKTTILSPSGINQLLVPSTSTPATFTPQQNAGAVNSLSGSAIVEKGGWLLPMATIDVLQPPVAAGTGSLAVACKKGLYTNWKGLKGGNIQLTNPVVQAFPGAIGILDSDAGKNIYCKQQFETWKDQQNPSGASVKLSFPKAFLYGYTSLAEGAEFLLGKTNVEVLTDRPVSVSGQPLTITTKDSVFVMTARTGEVQIGIMDENVLEDNYDPDSATGFLKPVSLALKNALFTTTPVAGLYMTGKVDDTFEKIKDGTMMLTLGIYSYLPTLPDPYAANLKLLKEAYRKLADKTIDAKSQLRTISLWLISHVQWTATADKDKDDVTLAFSFAPLQQSQLQNLANVADKSPAASPTGFSGIAAAITGVRFADQDVPNTPGSTQPLAMVVQPKNDEAAWNATVESLAGEVFSLIDVSSNANQMGISFSSTGRNRLILRTTHIADGGSAVGDESFPFQVSEMNVVTKGIHTGIFTVPQISWEPVFNWTNPADINPTHPETEPPAGLNYYPDDGGPTRIFNTSVSMVPLAPIPVADFIVDKFKNEKDNTVVSTFSLPFGMLAISVLNKEVDPSPPLINYNRPHYTNDLEGGIQLSFIAGLLSSDRFPLFHGGTMQMNNILGMLGNPTGTGTLGDSVGFIFNEEFKPKMDDLSRSRGVPLKRIDFSGYGASTFSDWYNPDAQFAQTSQSKFDVFVGRTAHEVIQVRSMIYPWGIRVVRSIVIFRSPSGYVHRIDTGWKAESDGLYDFTYRLRNTTGSATDFPPGKDYTKIYPTDAVFNMQPGLITGLFHINNIVEIGEKFPLANTIEPGAYYVDENNNVQKNNSGAPLSKPAMMKEIEFDCNIEIEGVEQGAVDGRVPCKKMKGYVQLAPMGTPISKTTLKLLHDYAGSSIGGSVNCVIDIGKNGQKMRINRVDTNSAVDKTGSEPVFVAAARGSVILPADGSWSVIQHSASTGEVTPLPAGVSVPVIRIGKVKSVIVTDPANPAKDKYSIVLEQDPLKQLIRIANPMELLRDQVAETVNFGFLQNTDTQKMLFLTPSFKKLTNPKEIARLLSKTPPIFADAYRLLNSKSIFPNIGDAISDFGDAIPLLTNFAQNTLEDAGKKVLDLIEINLKDALGNIEKEGYKLLKKVQDFDFPLPDKWYWVNESFLKIYIEYKRQDKSSSKPGKLNYDIDSFAAETGKKWLSKMSNISMVLDLGPFERLVTIKGNFDAKKGEEANYKGSDSDPSAQTIQIEYSDALQTVMDILKVLESLNTDGNYGDVLKKGLEIAMSNDANIWEYKFEVKKELPTIRFPSPDEVYNSPQTPLKLEANMKLGFYFNAALKVTTNPKELLPTAGAFFDFYGGMSVMCASIGGASVFARGEVTLGIAADIQKGPNLDMKFGFGAQIVAGYPLVGNVSVLFMIGVEIHMSATEIVVTASMLFKGHASLLGGVVAVTITIEAKGSVKKIGSGRTECSAQVTFAINISIFLVIDIDFSTSWQEGRQIA